jgi:hypothetical protein
MHCRLVTETTLVVWWSLGVFGLHGGWRKCGECICDDMLLLAWTSLTVDMVDGCGRLQRWWLAPVLFEVKVVPWSSCQSGASSS